MFNNSDSDNDTESGHTCSGGEFREVPLVNLFKEKYGDEGFYSGEEVDLMDEYLLEPSREEEGEAEEPRREELEASGTAQTIEVSTITPLVASRTLSNQNSQSYQSP
jgi:hypothetical protein